MKNIYLSVLYVLALTLVLSSSLLAYDIQFFGNGVLPTPEDEANIKAYIDLGQTQAGVEDWEKWQPESSTVIILPSNEDIQNHQDILRKMEENGKLVAVSDLLDDSQYPVFPPYSIFTENYHSIVFLNFVGDGSIFLDEESIQAIQKLTPEKIFVIGTEKNLPLIQEKLAIFESIPVEVIEREKITANYSQVASVPENPVILFFYSSRCPTCRKLKNETTIPIFEKYQDQIKVVYLDYIFSENYEKLVFLEEQWQVENTTSVELFSEAGYVAAEENENVNSKIEELIQKTISLSETDKKKVTNNIDSNQNVLYERFSRITLLMVIASGVIDGLNPCAFATIIFMVSLLTIEGHSRKRIFNIGITFSLTVFVTYLLIGLGLHKIWQIFAIQKYQPIIYKIMALILLVLAILSFKDALFYKKTKKETEFSLGLPKNFRLKINKYLKKSFSEKKLIIAAILSGFIISLVETGCTGQIYFPIITIIAKEGISLRAFIYLLIYNAFFIIPLLVVFLGVFFGSKSKSIVNFGRKNVLFSKIAIGLLFIGLSIFAWFYSLS